MDEHGSLVETSTNFPISKVLVTVDVLGFRPLNQVEADQTILTKERGQSQTISRTGGGVIGQECALQNPSNIQQ